MFRSHVVPGKAVGGGAGQGRAAPWGGRARTGAATFAPGTPAVAVRPDVERVITTHLPGSFTDTPLEAALRERGIERVAVSGFMTQIKRTGEITG